MGCNIKPAVSYYAEIKPNQLIEKLLTDEEFEQKHKKDVHMWYLGSTKDNIRKGFYEELPADKIQKYVTQITPQIIKCFQGDVQKIQMVGSTSVPGLPGMLSPDFCIFVKHFPPSETVIYNLENLGFRIAGLSHLDKKGDLWLLKQFQYWSQQGVDISSTMHILTQNSPSIKRLLGFRQLLKKDPKIFQEYKRRKLQLINSDQFTSQHFVHYKVQNSKVIQKTFDQIPTI